MRIVTLVENYSINENIGAEHGLSLYIETEKYKILFDMGQSDLFAVNAEMLGVDLAAVDFAILSHGHYDHGGGLKKFLEINKTAPVYIHKEAFGSYYNGVDKYIGLDTDLCGNDCGNDRIIFVEGEYEIAPGMKLYDANDKAMNHTLSGGGLNKLVVEGLDRIVEDSDLDKSVEAEFVPDDFRHEMYFVLEENGKLVLFSGCSHKGIMNIVDWFEADVLVGGFHFSKLPLDCTLENFAKYLDEKEVEYYTCHCTGREQLEFMQKYMRRLNYLSAGDRIEL